jgi:hypothetical protein
MIFQQSLATLAVSSCSSSPRVWSPSSARTTQNITPQPQWPFSSFTYSCKSPFQFYVHPILLQVLLILTFSLQLRRIHRRKPIHRRNRNLPLPSPLPRLLILSRRLFSYRRSLGRSCSNCSSEDRLEILPRVSYSRYCPFHPFVV